MPVVEKITGGKLDYIIANAAWASPWSAFRSIDSLWVHKSETGASGCSDYVNRAKEPEKLEEDYVYSFRVNVVGNVHLLNLFIPLVLKGDVKKVIHIASGQSSVEMIAKHDIFIMTPYAASKSAMNIVTSKFSGFYREQGVLFLSVAPGAVDTGYYKGDCKTRSFTFKKKRRKRPALTSTQSRMRSRPTWPLRVTSLRGTHLTSNANSRRRSPPRRCSLSLKDPALAVVMLVNLFLSLEINSGCRIPQWQIISSSGAAKADRSIGHIDKNIFLPLD